MAKTETKKPPEVTPTLSEQGPVEKVYRACAENYKLHGWKKEVRANDGRIIQAAQPLVFKGFLFVTKDVAEQEFIEASTAFKDKTGEITLEPSVDKAMSEVNRMIGRKGITSAMQSVSESTSAYGDLNQLPANLNSPE